jgi:hypothetical protein
MINVVRTHHIASRLMSVTDLADYMFIVYMLWP